MKKNKIKKIVSAMLSVLMLEMVNIDCILALAVDLNQNTSKTENTELLKVPELTDSALSLDVLPDSLLNELQVEFQNSVKLDKSTYADLYSIGTINKDGTKSLLTFNSPVKYLDNETNNIHFIDNNFVSAVGDEDIAFESCGNSYNARFSADISDGVLFSESGFAINMKPVDAVENNEPQIINNELIYNNAFDDKTDISYALENSGIKESIIVDEPTGCSTYSFTISADGLVPDTESGKSITLLDETNGEPVFVIQPIYIIDSYIGEYIDGEEHITYDNYYDIELQDDGTYLLQMNLDEEFLNAESTIYPCIIDPSIWAVDLYNNSSSYVQQSGGYGYVNNELSAGTFNGSGEHLSYVKANDVDQYRWITPKRLISAEFRVKAASTGYTNSCTIDCYDSMVNIPVSSVYYSQLVSSLGELQSSTTFTTLGSTYSFDVTNLFKQWIAFEREEGGKDPSYGFILKGAAGASTPGRIFSSTSSSDSYFYLIYEEGGEIDDGIYYIRNKHSNKYLNIDNNATSNGTSVTQFGYHGDKNQQFQVTYEADGYYSIRPMHINNQTKSIDLQSSSLANTDGTDAQIWEYSSSYNKQKFIITSAVGGGYQIGTKSSSGSKVLEVTNSSLDDNAIVQIWSYSDSRDNDNWYFEEVNFGAAPSFSETIPTGNGVNCIGYAFVLDKFVSYGDMKFSSEDTSVENRAMCTVNYIKDLHRSIRIIAGANSPTFPIAENEYRVALRVEENYYDPDYHYMLQLDDGSWAHKQGTLGQPERLGFINPSEYTWHVHGSNTRQYDSDVIYFAVTR